MRAVCQVIPEHLQNWAEDFQQRGPVMMRDLRVYVCSLSAGTLDMRAVFYSRRADGPYYRWFYEEEVGRWHFSRVRLSKLTLRELCAASWKAVPSELQARLGEHYLE